MMTKQIKISLSRGHKIVERLTREIDSLNSTLIELTRPVTVSVPAEIDQISDISVKIENNLKIREELYAVLEVVRSKIAKKNASSGIQELLSERSILTNRKNSLSQIIINFQANNSSRSSVSVLPNNKQLVEDYFKRMEKAEVLNAVKVSVVNEELTAKFTTELKEVQFKLDELSDKINNVNARSTISFELSEEVATKIGL